ncbi:outer membrane porin F precursor [Variibacter gotjawalensis]|uniref:Outer membrane porin F n=1 Tax=Variibacter gotjawalensis TaxID=1333996 RepID=A0A0S3PPZ5_9BRAD|nr:OmpA family protein [Variibacter gotjawalensis]NIK48320.1 outer membrane protein OmpA-like peptidoglycan-associated protein [Variibacter gotjawalensis]RZS50191.1 OmpA family protein [Variibacter gotjawalensis]BAT58022.1 outer membrane porin F precursor [Variibacter gotjawalensis]
MLSFRSLAALCFGALVTITAAHADLGFPESVKFPPQIVVDPDQKLQQETVGETEFIVDATGSTTETKRGRHFTRWLTYRPARGEPALGYDNGSETRIFNAMRGALEKAGWALVYVDDNKARFVMRMSQGGRDNWLGIKMDAPQAQVNVDLVEVSGAPANALKLPPPGARPERIADNADIPYLPPYPGSKLKGGGRGDGPLNISRPGSGEEVHVGGVVLTRNYQGPETLSKLQFIGEYREALIAADWEILFPNSAAAVNDNATLVAHFTKNGRDVWAKLDYEYGANLWYSVLDLGAEDLKSKLDKDCSVALHGVFFDFNKATLKPESEAALTRAAALLTATPGAKIEVQGHTDNVGGDDYNLKLSHARAESVMRWLTQHRIEAQRLSAKGYGKAQPFADNGTDIGRAKNRRVELSKVGCRK